MPASSSRTIRTDDESEVTIYEALMGAEGRYEDYIYIDMIEREWNRPLPAGLGHETATAPRAAVVLLFWSYFETRIERLLRAGMRGVPERIREDCLRRYSSIGARLNNFYRVVFDSRYADDLGAAGFPLVASHLAVAQERRNRFVHGDPRAIDDDLAMSVVSMLKDEHEAWIAVFNRRVATR
jgi:hypothetical protein